MTAATATVRPPATEQRPPLLLRSLAELLQDPTTLQPPEAVVPRLAYRGRTTLVVGREKYSGKSTLLTAAAAAVTHGATFLDGQCADGTVLWVTADQEHSGEIVQRAVRFGAVPERLYVLWPHQPFADLMAAVDVDMSVGVATIDPMPVLIVIDTLASFARTMVTDPHASGEWPGVILPLVRLARDHNIAVVLAHHARKTEGGGYRDSTAIGALVDVLLELQPDASNSARRNVAVVGRWAATNFAIELVGDSYQLVAGGDLSLDAKILAFVQANPRSSLRAVRTGVGGRADDVDHALGRLLASKAVENAGTDARHAYVAANTTAAAPPEDSDAPPF